MTAPLYISGEALLFSKLAEFGVDMPIVRTDPQSGVVTNLSIRAMTVNPQSYIIHTPSYGPVDERLISDSRVEPKETDNLTKDGVRFNVTRVDKIKPGDLLIGYRLELRRA